MDSKTSQEITNYFKSALDHAIKETLKKPYICDFDNQIYNNKILMKKKKANIEYVKKVLYLIHNDLLYDFICRSYVEYLHHINMDILKEEIGIPLRGKYRKVLFDITKISKRTYETGKKDIPGNFDILEATGISSILIHILADTRFGNKNFIKPNNLKYIYKFLYEEAPEKITYSDTPEIDSKHEKDLNLVNSGFASENYSNYIDFISRDPIRLYLMENYLKTCYITNLSEINRYIENNPYNCLGLNVMKTFEYGKYHYDIEHYANHHLPLTARRISTLLSYSIYEVELINIKHIIFVVIREIFATFHKFITEKPLPYKCQVGIENVLKNIIDDIKKTIKFCEDTTQIENIFCKYKKQFACICDCDFNIAIDRIKTKFKEYTKIIINQSKAIKKYIRNPKNLDLINDTNLSTMIEKIKSTLEDILCMIRDILCILDRIFCLNVNDSYSVADDWNSKNTYLYQHIEYYHKYINWDYNDIILLYESLHEYEMKIERLICQLDIKYMNHIYVIHDFLRCNTMVETYIKKYKPITESYKFWAKDEAYKNIFLVGLPYLYCMPEVLSMLGFPIESNTYSLVNEVNREYIISRNAVEFIYNISNSQHKVQFNN